MRWPAALSAKPASAAFPAVPLRGGDRHLMNVPQLTPRAAASAAGALAGLSAWAARSLTGFETQTLLSSTKKAKF